MEQTRQDLLIAKVTLDMDDTLSPESHSLFRTCVGKLQFMVPIRPDVAYAPEELARGLVSPTNQSWNKLRHLGRYLQGTKNYVLVISPRMQLSGRKTPLELDLCRLGLGRLQAN